GMEQRLATQGASLSADEAARLQRETDALRRSIERTRSRLQQELNQRVDQELSRAWPLMEAAVAEYAREAGYDLVLASPQLYASGRIDITDRVLDRLRQQARAAGAQWTAPRSTAWPSWPSASASGCMATAACRCGASPRCSAQGRGSLASSPTRATVATWPTRRPPPWCCARPTWTR